MNTKFDKKGENIMLNNQQNIDHTIEIPVKNRQSRLMTLAILTIMAFILMIPTIGSQADANQVRIKDIVQFEGVRDNVLVGYGLIVGLNGTGDTLANTPFTQQSLVAMLERLGVNIGTQNINTNTVAAVMVTAKLPPFAKHGTTIDVQVSAMGDSESLQGGTLLATPLIGADGEVYAVAQGSIVASGFTAGGEADTVTQNIPTQARLSNGGIIEREIDFDLETLKTVNITLRNPDFTTARRVEKAINDFLQFPAARAESPSNIVLMRSPDMEGSVFNIITDIEQLKIRPDQVARVVIDETSGIIVMGQNVTISTVAIAQGNLTIRVTETPLVSQPQPFAQGGTTEVVNRTAVGVDSDSAEKLAVLSAGVTLQELVESLNALGVGPRDMISILQSIKAAGALQAEIQLL